MPHTVLRAAMQERVEACCDRADAEAVVDGLLRMGVRVPAFTVTDAAELAKIPDGSAVLVGNPLDRARVSVGMKSGQAILFAGEDEPYPFHQGGLAPPLPCTVIWLPGESIGFPATFAERVRQDRQGVEATLAYREHESNEGAG